MIMNKFKTILNDVLYVSKLTGTKNKKILITSSILLSQLSAGIDLFLIATFASIVAKQNTNIESLNNILVIIDKNRVLVILLVFTRYAVHYLQATILKKIVTEAKIIPYINVLKKISFILSMPKYLKTDR